MTRILITGSRTWTDWQQIRDALKCVHDRFPDAVLVHGAAYGADCIAAAMWQHAGGTVESWPLARAPWTNHGRRAGPMRNAHMVSLGADLCLAFIRGASRGATGCSDLAERAGIPTQRYHQDGL